MKKLSTIQKRENLSEVYVMDEKGNGGANHQYLIIGAGCDLLSGFALEFQNGPRKDPKSTNGIVDQDLLEIVRHRLQGFQSGELSTRETAIALTHVEEALLWLNKRIEDRIERNVLGTNNQ